MTAKTFRNLYWLQKKLSTFFSCFLLAKLNFMVFSVSSFFAETRILEGHFVRGSFRTSRISQLPVHGPMDIVMKMGAS